MSKNNHTLLGLSHVKRSGPLLVILAFALLGVYLQSISRAATNVAAKEAENGAIAGAASSKASGTASGGGYVQFGSSVGGVGGCTSGGVAAPCIGSSNTGASGWANPVFDDEFNGTGLNSTYWEPSWFGSGGVMNDVTTNPANVAVSGGNLILTLSSSSSGALVSSNPNGGADIGFQFTYGFAEARILFPGSGSNIYNWPAFWTDGQAWPANGEIDIAEGLGTLTSNYHSSSGANNSGTIPGIWAGGYHTYAVNRQPGKNDIYWDGILVRSYLTSDSGAAHYFIINVGSGSPSVTGVNSQVKVDYVRFWQK